MPDTPSDVAIRLAEIADHVTLNTEPCPSHERQRCVARALDTAGVAEAVEKLENIVKYENHPGGGPDYDTEEYAAAALAALRGDQS